MLLIFCDPSNVNHRFFTKSCYLCPCSLFAMHTHGHIDENLSNMMRINFYKNINIKKKTNLKMDISKVVSVQRTHKLVYSSVELSQEIGIPRCITNFVMTD